MGKPVLTGELCNVIEPLLPVERPEPKEYVLASLIGLSLLASCSCPRPASQVDGLRKRDDLLAAPT